MTSEERRQQRKDDREDRRLQKMYPWYWPGTRSILLRIQNGRCAICGEEDDLCIDHVDNAVRGLLCRRHNLGMGYFKTIEQLKAAVRYFNRAVTTYMPDQKCWKLNFESAVADRLRPRRRGRPPGYRPPKVRPPANEYHYQAIFAKPQGWSDASLG